MLRRLYTEDADVGHIAAVQEIYAGARPGSALAAQLALETRRWEELAEELLTALLRGKPLAAAVRVRVAASAAVAFYLGMETLTHLDGRVLDSEPTAEPTVLQTSGGNALTWANVGTGSNSGMY